MRPHRFHDRRDAGRLLGQRLAPLADERPIVIGLARGGVPVAFEVAMALRAPLDVLLVRKIGAPGNPELGMGAVAEGGVRFFNESMVRSLHVSPDEMTHAVTRAEAELDERLARFRGDRPPIDVAGRTVVIVDDGLATGGTARAAARALRERGPSRLVLAVPVGAAESVQALEPEVDELVCLLVPEMMWAVGAWYERFGQTSDDEVAALLAQARETQATGAPAGSSAGAGPAPARRREARIPVPGGDHVLGDLVVPEGAAGIVVFAHGSGSSRHSPRNREVAEVLNGEGFATLLMDLLTVEEERYRSNVFDIALLAGRLVSASRWVRDQPDLRDLPLGYFGASTGAGAALWAAADLGEDVQAVVSRGGRPDLAAPRLAEVGAPTLLIVGGRDDIVIELNRDALARLRCEAALEVVPGATHLFEEPGTLEAVQRLAADWFTRHLSPRSGAGTRGPAGGSAEHDS